MNGGGSVSCQASRQSTCWACRCWPNSRRVIWRHGNLFRWAPLEGSTNTVRPPQIQLRIEENVSQRDREKCRMLWVAVPGHHRINNLEVVRNIGFQSREQ